MRVKPTHLAACAEVLEGDYETAAEAARAVIATIDRLRADDLTYTVVRQYAGPIYVGYGPYATFNAARKAIEGGKAGSAESAATAIVPVRSPEKQAARLAELDELPDIPNNHWARILERADRA